MSKKRKNKEYIIHLLAEISNYILEGQPQRMVISLHHEEDGMHLSVLDDRARGADELEDMRRALNPGARPELADYYGSMGGSDLLGRSNLSLIGWQIKRADVGSTAEGTKIDLWLGSDRFDSMRFNMPE
jgi:hypothetical protein